MNIKILKKLAIIINLLTGFYSLLMISILMCFYRFDLGFYQLFSLFFSSLLVISIKNIVKKERKDLTLNENRAFGNKYSFPSGHTASLLSFAIIFFYFKNNSFIIFLVILAFVIFFKICTKQHDFADISCGILIGFISSLSSILICKSIFPNIKALIESFFDPFFRPY